MNHILSNRPAAKKNKKIFAMAQREFFSENLCSNSFSIEQKRWIQRTTRKIIVFKPLRCDISDEFISMSSDHIKEIYTLVKNDVLFFNDLIKAGSKQIINLEVFCENIVDSLKNIHQKIWQLVFLCKQNVFLTKRKIFKSFVRFLQLAKSFYLFIYQSLINKIINDKNNFFMIDLEIYEKRFENEIRVNEVEQELKIRFKEYESLPLKEQIDVFYNLYRDLLNNYYVFKNATRFIYFLENKLGYLLLLQQINSIENYILEMFLYIFL